MTLMRAAYMQIKSGTVRTMPSAVETERRPAAERKPLPRPGSVIRLGDTDYYVVKVDRTQSPAVHAVHCI